MEEVFQVVSKAYEDLEKHLRKECKKRKWSIDFDEGRVKSINGFDGRLLHKYAKKDDLCAKKH